MRAARRPLALLLLLATVGQAHDRPALVTVDTSPAHDVDGGQWHWMLERTQTPWACGAKAQPQQCVEHSIVVDNQSPQSLECMASLAYVTADGMRITDPDLPALVLPRARHEMRGRITAAETRIEVTRLECRARAPYQRIKPPEGCKYEMHGDPLEAYYPAAAVSLAFEGPVTVSFLLKERTGLASEIAIADSSLVPMLDAAARRFVGDQHFYTQCPGTRFDMRVRFTLRDRYLEAPTP